MVASLAMMFSIMTSYARARAESLIDKCKVGFMERPERIVLFMIGAFTNRMAAVLWVILILSIVDGRQPDPLHLSGAQHQAGSARVKSAQQVFWRAFFWTDERTTLPYDLWVIAILAFVWLTPPDWIHDPTAPGLGLWARVVNRRRDGRPSHQLPRRHRRLSKRDEIPQQPADRRVERLAAVSFDISEINVRS